MNVNKPIVGPCTADTKTSGATPAERYIVSGPVTARLCDMATLLLSPLAQMPGLPYRFGCRLRATGCSNGCPR